MSPSLAAFLAPFKKPRNWCLLFRAIVAVLITYGAAAPDDPGPHVHLPPWAWVLLGVLILVLNELLDRWWPADAPVVRQQPGLTRDDPPHVQIGPPTASGR